jgi:uncharacterized protein YcbK (DUF882 family)
MKKLSLVLIVLLQGCLIQPKKTNTPTSTNCHIKDTLYIPSLSDLTVTPTQIALDNKTPPKTTKKTVKKIVTPQTFCPTSTQQKIQACIQNQMNHTLNFHHLHTNEIISCPYRNQTDYCPKALTTINHNLRDWRANQSVSIDKTLLDYLFFMATLIQKKYGLQKVTYQIICGYRSETTNQKLRARSKAVARKSLHTIGKAIDLRVKGLSLKTLHALFKKHQLGGLGLYTKSNFIHIDTGAKRRWGS